MKTLEKQYDILPSKFLKYLLYIEYRQKTFYKYVYTEKHFTLDSYVQT